MLINIVQNQRYCLTSSTNIISASRIVPLGYIYSVCMKLAQSYLFDKFAKLCRILALKANSREKERKREKRDLQFNINNIIQY